MPTASPQPAAHARSPKSPRRGHGPLSRLVSNCHPRCPHAGSACTEQTRGTETRRSWDQASPCHRVRPDTRRGSGRQPPRQSTGWVFTSPEASSTATAGPGLPASLREGGAVAEGPGSSLGPFSQSRPQSRSWRWVSGRSDARGPGSLPEPPPHTCGDAEGPGCSGKEPRFHRLLLANEEGPGHASGLSPVPPAAARRPRTWHDRAPEHPTGPAVTGGSPAVPPGGPVPPRSGRLPAHRPCWRGSPGFGHTLSPVCGPFLTSRVPLALPAAPLAGRKEWLCGVPPSPSEGPEQDSPGALGLTAMTPTEPPGVGGPAAPPAARSRRARLRPLSIRVAGRDSRLQ